MEEKLNSNPDSEEVITIPSDPQEEKLDDEELCDKSSDNEDPSSSSSPEEPEETKENEEEEAEPVSTTVEEYNPDFPDLELPLDVTYDSLFCFCESNDNSEDLDRLIAQEDEYFATDSTSHMEITIHAEANYVGNLVDCTKEIFNCNSLISQLKESASETGLNQAKNQIKNLWHSHQSFIAHSDIFAVRFLIMQGIILTVVEKAIGKKSVYMKWVRDNYDMRHIRYFQQAKQLAKMGKFARLYCSLGKNRLLEIDRLRKSLEKDLKEIAAEHPFPDTTDDDSGILTKIHVDAVISFHRLKDGGVDFISFQQASLIASLERSAILIGKAKKIGKWLNEFETEEEKKKNFKVYLLDKMTFPSGASVLQKQNSLVKRLVALNEYKGKINIDNTNEIEKLKRVTPGDYILEAYQFLGLLIEKFGLNNESNNNQN